MSHSSDWNGCSSYGLQGVRPEMGIKIFTPELIEKMSQCISMAEKLAANDPVHLKRVGMGRRVFEETTKYLGSIQKK